MDKSLAEKLVGELLRFSRKNIAITNRFGEVLAKTPGFSLSHNPLDIKSKKAFPIALEGKKMGFLFVDEDAKTVNEMGKVMKSMADLVVHQAYFSEIITSDEKRADQLVYDFLNSEEGNGQEEQIRSLKSFGINLSKNRLAVFLEITDPTFLFLDSKEITEGERERKIARVKGGIKTVLSSFYTHHTDNIVSYLGGDHFIIFKDMGDDSDESQEEFKKTLNSLYYNLKNELRTDITIGVGDYKKGIKGLKTSFEEANTALRFGQKVWGEGKIFHYDNFGVVAPLFSGAKESNISYSRKIIERLEEHPELAESLRQYFELDLSLSKTAKKLKIHRNTLVYRLEKIGEITALDPRVFNDAFQLQMALILNKYSGQDGTTKKS
jgi:carbohydrate diacid regulator